MSESPLVYAAGLLEGCADSDQKQWALAHLACAAARYGDCADARSILSPITHFEARFFAMEQTVRHCLEARGSVKLLRENLSQLVPQSAVGREEPGTLFAVCLDSGLFNDALEICDLYADAYCQSSALARLASRMAPSDSKGKVPELLLRVRRLLPAIENVEDRDSILSEIANVCAASGLITEWRDAVESIQMQEYRMEPLAAMAARNPAFFADLVATGCSLLNSPNVSQKLWPIEEPIKVCLGIGRIDEALQLVRSMPEGTWRDRGLLAICTALIRAYQLDRSCEIARGIHAQWFQARVLSLLGAAYNERGDSKIASEVLGASADRIQNADLSSDQVLWAAQWAIELSGSLAKNGLNERADRLMHRVEKDRRIPVNSKVEALLDCARRAVSDDTSFARNALASAFRIADGDGPYAIHWHARIAAQYQRILDPHTAQAVLERAFFHVPAALQTLWMVAEAYRAAEQRFSPELERLLARFVSGGALANLQPGPTSQ
jgi:hypothetical protein